MYSRIVSISIISIAVFIKIADAGIIRGDSRRNGTRRTLQGGFFTGGVVERDSAPTPSPVNSPSVEEGEREAPKVFQAGENGETGETMVVQPNVDGAGDEGDDDPACSPTAEPSDDDGSDDSDKKDDKGGKGDKKESKGDKKDDKKHKDDKKKCKDKKGASSDGEDEEGSLQVAGNLEVDEKGNVIAYDEDGNILTDAESSASPTTRLSWSLGIVSVVWTLVYGTGGGFLLFLTAL